MVVSEAKTCQGLLFSEPSYSETGVWCVLNEGVDPAQWAGLCRKMGGMKGVEFEVVRELIISYSQGRKRVQEKEGIPLVSLGPSGLGGGISGGGLRK